jgi:hypothetical protein
MKNLMFLLLVGLLFSCDIVEDNNNPGFQISIDNTFWYATDVKAFQNPNGSILIKALTTNETFDILVPSRVVPNSQFRDYPLGMTSTANASYTYNAEGITVNYTTGNNIGGSGNVKIKRHPNVDTDVSISGELTFQGVQTTDNLGFPEKRNFIRGTFYNIPIQIVP